MTFFVQALLTLLRSLGFMRVWDVLKLPNPKYLVSDLIPEKCLGMIYGPSGVGKSFFIIDLMLSVAAGLLWNGHKTRKGLVVYVIGEGGYGIKFRILAWLQKSRKLASHMPCIVRTEPINLYTQAEVDKFIEELKKINDESPLPIVMVVFDTLARCSVGADENSNTAMGVVVKNCERIQKEIDTTAVILVHHTGKNEESYRGASCVYAAMDVVISIQRLGKKSNRRFIIAVEKQKDGEALPDMQGSLVQVQLDGKAYKGQTSCLISYEGFAANDTDATGTDTGNLNELTLKRMEKILEFVDSFGASGVEWDKVRKHMKQFEEDNAPVDQNGQKKKPRSSNLTDARAHLTNKGLVVVKNDIIVSVSAMTGETKEAA